ncbi:MAG: amidohydrolase family protein [candidate division WOR-3 bacterium]
MQALQAATHKAAEFLGMADSLGTVEKGKIADLVLLEADPLEDISNTRKIAAVVVNVKYYPRTALDEMLAQVEALANLQSIVEPMLKTITQKDINSAIRQYHDLKATEPDIYDFSESELNMLGYRLLRMKKIQEAIEIFKHNVEIFPRSYNTYDSLAEAYVVKGDKKLAIKNYKRSLALNHHNWSATEKLKKLKMK